MPFYRCNPKGSGGSADYSSFYVRLNNQDDYLITSNFATTVFAENNAYKNLNVPVSVGDNIADTTGMLKSCMKFNQPVTLGMRIRHADTSFYTCTNFNQPITIPPVVETAYNAFANCYNFNSYVDFSLSNVLTTCEGIFRSCNNFNQPVTIQTNKFLQAGHMFENCTNFNSPVHISAPAINISSMFSNCLCFNQPITINAIVKSNSNIIMMFYNCSNFNQPIEIKYNSYGLYTNIYANNMFYNCTSFNSPMTFNEVYKNDTDTGSLHIWLESVFMSCTNYNQPFNMPNRTYSANYLFAGCTNFNQKIYLPDGLAYAYGMYLNSAFNQPYEINCPTLVVIDSMFYGCTNFNSTITFNVPRVSTLKSMFANSAFNQNIYIPSQINNLYHTFANCKSFSKNVYIQGTYRVLNVAGMFNGCDNTKRKNIFFNKALNSTFGQTGGTSVIGASITWTNITGNVGFYNATYNIYCYNNYSG